MPVNREMKIIFIHIPKCAGTSIAKTLDMYDKNYPPNLDTLYGITKQNIVLQSLCLEFYNQYLNDKFIKKCKIFTVVRNPYDRILSDYMWSNRKCSNMYDFCKLIENTLKHKSKYSLMSFDINTHSNHFLPQYEFINNSEYNINHVFKFENLKNDFEKVFSDKKLLHINKTKHPHFIDYFKNKPKCVKIINDIYKEDFMKFGYNMIV